MPSYYYQLLPTEKSLLQERYQSHEYNNLQKCIEAAEQAGRLLDAPWHVFEKTPSTSEFFQIL